jgi:hypothetical protein
MESEGTLLGALLEDLAEQRTFRFSAPWRPRDSFAVVVPVIRTVETHRDYLTLQESTRVQLKETGQVVIVQITNGETVPVFVRLGTVLKGVGTQSRAVNASVFVEPGETKDLSVNCVHATHPIGREAGFAPKMAQVAPVNVERGLFSREQGSVWSEVKAYSTAREEIGVESGTPTPLDDLANRLGLEDRFSELVDRLIKELPNHEGQVGIVVLDESGVYGLEVFGSSESWIALSDSVVTKFGEKLVGRREGGCLEVRVNEAKAKDEIVQFLKAATHGGAVVVEQPEMTTTVRIEGRAIGEAIFRGRRFVHLTLLRNDAREQGPLRRRTAPPRLLGPRRRLPHFRTLGLRV